MPLSPYISFAGNCAEATAFYQQAVGAELLYKITFGEMPKSDNSEEGCPSGMQFPDSAIAHSNVRIAGSDIMMSDGMPPGSNAQYAGFTLVLDTQDVNEGKRWFDNLAAGGNIDVSARTVGQLVSSDLPLLAGLSQTSRPSMTATSRAPTTAFRIAGSGCRPDCGGRQTAPAFCGGESGD